MELRCHIISMRQNGFYFWRDAICKEMDNLKIAFDILPDDKNLPPGYSKASDHIIFDVQMTLERKARWVSARLVRVCWHCLA